MTQPPPAVPGPPARDGAVLDPDEMTIGYAYARLTSLMDRLIAAPFDRAVYTDLESYLRAEAWHAADAFERIVSRGEWALADRVAAIEAATAATEHGRPL